MAATEAFVGKGTVLKRGDGGGPEVFTAVAEVKTADGFEWVRALADATHLTSDNDYRERKPAMKDVSPLSMEMNLVPTSTGQGVSMTTGLGLDFENGTLRNFQFVFSDPGGLTIQFAAFVTKWKINGVNNDGVVTATIELHPQGKPTVTL